MIIAGIGLGVSFSLGVFALSSWRQSSKHSMARDVSRHVGIPVEESRLSSWLTGTLHQFLARSPQSPWGSDRHIDKLISQSGQVRTRHSARSSQLLALAFSMAAIAAWSLARQITHHHNSAFLVGLLLLTAFPVSGWLVKVSLEDDVARRAREVGAKLPGAIELLAFSVAAGEPIVAGLNRVATLTSGALSESLNVTVSQINAGTTMSRALRELANSVNSSQLNRAVHAIELALDRGTPLADVLRAQASDARAQHARDLMVLAGKKETAMMIPVVFLILPMIVLVAIYPGLIALRVM